MAVRRVSSALSSLMAQVPGDARAETQGAESIAIQSEAPHTRLRYGDERCS